MVKKIFLILGIILVSTYAKAQVYNINEAETLAKKENKLILIKRELIWKKMPIIEVCKEKLKLRLECNNLLKMLVMVRSTHKE
jgi:hypothetical protein